MPLRLVHQNPTLPPRSTNSARSVRALNVYSGPNLIKPSLLDQLHELSLTNPAAFQAVQAFVAEKLGRGAPDVPQAPEPTYGWPTI